ncbi:MAG: bifunctional riboflavin kinase/FAD synthetase [Flavobacteriales bacterium]
MKIYNHIDEFSSQKPVVLTTGTFDGVHLGHQNILNRIIELAQQIDGESVVLTFSPHPRHVLNPNSDIKLIQSLDEKLDAFRALNIDHVIVHPFTKAFAELSSDAFIRTILTKKLRVSKLVIGYDHHFGKNRTGSFEHLVEHGTLYGFDVEEIPARDVDEVKVSSTKIRRALAEGNMEKAKQYLSRCFELEGKVVHGQKLGRTLGFPTANLQLSDPHKLIPKPGVYAVDLDLEGRTHKGMLNIGTKPTVVSKSTDNQLSIEVHIIDFDKELYGKSLVLRFKKRIREEIKFDSLTQLKRQLEEDLILSKIL